MKTPSVLSSRFLTNTPTKSIDAKDDDLELSFSLCHDYWHLYLC